MPLRADGRRPAGPGRSRRRALALAGVLLVSACGVPRSDRAAVDRADFSTLPNLRRAQEELQAQITREEEHVAALLERKLSLRAEEDRTYQDMLDAEQDFQLRQADLAAVQADRDRAEVQLAAARAALEEVRTQHAAVLAETERLLAELADLQRLVERGQVALDALPEPVRALLAELPESGADAPAHDEAEDGGAATPPDAAGAPAPDPVPGEQPPADAAGDEDGAADDEGEDAADEGDAADADGDETGGEGGASRA